MASHCHHPHHHHHHHQPPPPPPPPPCTHCCCNPSPTCCTTHPPPPQDHHFLLQAIASLLSQPQHPITTIPPTHHHHYPKSHTFLSQTHHHQQHQHQHQTHSASISSLLHRIESLESSLLTHHHHHSLSSPSSSLSLRHAAARVIQTHFRSFLARRSRTLRHLKHLALIKSTFNSLKSSLSQNNTHHLDFPALSLKAFNLLLQLDSIEGCDPMIVDGKKSITRDLVQFLDSIEGVAVKKHMHCVKSTKSGRLGQRVNKSRDSDDDERRKLLQNLRSRVERINRLCKVSENDEGDFEHEGLHNVVGGDYDIYDDGHGVSNVVISGRNEVFPKKNVVFVQRQGVQPRVKKSVTFAENGKICEVYSGGSGSACEPDLSGDVVCLDGSSSSDDQGEVLEHVDCAVEDDVDHSQGAEDDEEALVENDGGSPHSSDDGGRNPTRATKNDGKNIVKGQIQTQQGKILFSAPMPLKMENKAELMKSKGVRILT